MFKGFRKTVAEAASRDLEYKDLVAQVQNGTIRRYWLEDGLLYAKGDRLFVPSKGGLRRVLLKEVHDSPWAGHPGRERTLALLTRDYYWPRMDADIESYVKACLVCQLDKAEMRKVEGMSSVLVVVDRFSKYAIFIAAPEACLAETAAALFYKNVVKYFGVPVDLVARDRQDIIDQAQDSLRKANKRMKKYADAKRRPLEFEVGDQVLLKLTPRFGRKSKANGYIGHWFQSMMVRLKL
ncbi:hypothetical protein Pint_13111 [Pistacia integerrima]|uniref:Uncharacterized protein n=1 Tax=Pistacia integerrima TaxID=434235 RepID=A0ACC0YB84_9ROSI|nr:hypothetical protein Pint_13111 [Pistacia integerrima]